MNIQHIRNATLVVEYAGKNFLIDPMLSDKGTYPPFPNSARQDQKNPLVELPVSIEDIIKDIDAVIVTHLHYDHWDEAAAEALPKDIKLFTQNDEDKDVIAKAGFTNIEVLTENTVFEGIKLIKTAGEHGRGEVLKMAGFVCGIVFKYESEKTLYVAGDTVWYDVVRQTIEAHSPEVIVVNAGDNQFDQGGSLVMEENDVHEVVKAAPNAKVISVHMEAVNHWNLSREDLKKFAAEKGIEDNIIVPDDGDKYKF